MFSAKEQSAEHTIIYYQPMKTRVILVSHIQRTTGPLRHISDVLIHSIYVCSDLNTAQM